MGIPGPYIGQQSQKMCVVCGRLTANDLVCDLCQSKRGPNSENAHLERRPAPTANLQADGSSPAFWWFVLAGLGVMFIALLSIYFDKKASSGHQELTAGRDERPIESHLVKPPEAPTTQAPSTPASQPNTVSYQQPNYSSGAVVRSSPQGGFVASSGQAEMASSDNIIQESVGVSGPDVFMDTFRQEYEKDLENKKYQSWDTYWESVRGFYSGSGHSGWVAIGNRALAHVKNDLRQTIRQKWDNLGVLIAREASKSSFTRRINPSDVSSFLSTLEGALSEDRGDGATIAAKIDEVSKAASELKS